MADRMSKEQRSKAMAAVRGKGNRTTEKALVKVMRTEKISGWRRHPIGIEGKPDFIFPQTKLVVFVDGCFWHGCRQCCSLPRNNRKFWKDKIERNISRDKFVNRLLKRRGWRIVRIWEHEIKKGLKSSTFQQIRH